MSVADKVVEWESDGANGFLQMLNLLDFNANAQPWDYLPSRQEHLSFLDRLDKWIENATTVVDQQNLLRLAHRLLFIAPEELNSLINTAFYLHVLPWICEIQRINPFNQGADAKIEEFFKRYICLCGATDSSKVQEFSKHLAVSKHQLLIINHWQDDQKSLVNKIRKQAPKAVLIIDDFAGSGRTMDKLLPIAETLRDQSLPVLILILISCKEARTAITLKLGTMRNPPRVEFVLALSDVTSIQPKAKYSGHDEREGIRDSLLRLGATRKWKSIDIFGVGECGLVATKFDNCPNNSVGALHSQKSGWYPLFPRATKPRLSP